MMSTSFCVYSNVDQELVKSTGLEDSKKKKDLSNVYIYNNNI